jgi:hypothetical protein
MASPNSLLLEVPAEVGGAGGLQSSCLLNFGYLLRFVEMGAAAHQQELHQKQHPAA